MQDKYYYPLICTDRFSKTVAFYEDHFGFIVGKENPYYALLCHLDNQDVRIAIIDMDSPALPKEAKQKTTGLVINFPVEDIRAVYQQYYWEGLDLCGDPKEDCNGDQHFFVCDPNGVYINVLEKIEPDNCCPEDELMTA